MGFFDKILVGLGFEADEKEPKPKKIKEKKQKQTIKTQRSLNDYGVSFNLDKKQEQVPEFEEESIKQQNNVEEQINTYAKNSGFDIELPKSQEDIQNIIDHIAGGKTIIVNVSGFNATDRVRALDFLAGALYTLRGKIQLLEGNLYILYPNI